MLHHDRMAGAGGILGRLWQEYALADSRYMISDPLVLCMEACTVVCISFIFCVIYLALCRVSPLKGIGEMIRIWIGVLCFAL